MKSQNTDKDQEEHDARDRLREGVEDMVEQRSAAEIAHWLATAELGAPFVRTFQQEEAQQGDVQEGHALAVHSEDEEALDLFRDSIESLATPNWMPQLLVNLVEVEEEHSAVNPFQHEPFHIVQLYKDQDLLARWDRMVQRPETCRIDERHDVEEVVLSVLPWLLELHS
jgi:hypothetical protein